MRVSFERQKYIEGTIDLLEERTGLHYPNDSLFDIARALDVEIYTQELPAEENGTVNGVIEHTGGVRPKARIYINENLPKSRRTFTLAHEIGHFLLHPSEEKFRVDVVDYTKPESRDESEANYFAASLLMPKDDLKKLLKVTNDTRDIAKYFAVSEKAVMNRLEWLRTNR